MINNIQPINQINDTVLPQPVPDKPVKIEPASQTQTQADLGKDKDFGGQGFGQQAASQLSYNLRLTVEKDFSTGEVIYKAIDRQSGEVVRQLPSKEVLEMKKNKNYRPGSIIKTDM
jgi:hypothetical protein